MPLPSVEGFGAGVTSSANQCLTLAYRHEGLEALTVDHHRGTGTAAGGGQADDTFRHLVGHRRHYRHTAIILEGYLHRIGGRNAGRGGNAQLHLEAATGIGYRGDRGLLVVARVIDDLYVEAAEPSSFLLGKPLPRTTAMVPTRPVSGVMVTSRAGMSTRTTAPVRPPESVTRIPDGRSPSAVVAELQGQVHRSRPVTAAVDHPRRVSVVDAAPRKYYLTANGNLGFLLSTIGATPGDVLHWS